MLLLCSQPFRGFLFHPKSKANSLGGGQGPVWSAFHVLYWPLLLPPTCQAMVSQAFVFAAQISTSHKALLAWRPPLPVYVSALSFSSCHVFFVHLPSLKYKLLTAGPCLFYFSAVSLGPRMVPSISWRLDKYVLEEWMNVSWFLKVDFPRSII